MAPRPTPMPGQGGQPVARDVTVPQRLFLALWPDVQVRRALAAWRDGFHWPDGAAPVADERLHLTLHFLGDVAAARVPGLQAALRVRVLPFELTLDRAVAWPGGLVVLQPTRPPPALAALHAALGQALRASALPVERRAFRPHVTLARRASGVALPEAADALRWTVTGYALVRSQLVTPARYETLWTHVAA